MSGGLDVSWACLALVLGGGVYVFGGRSSRKVVDESVIVKNLHTVECRALST